MRAFMHGEIGTDAVAGAVVEVEARLPERSASKAVELRAGRSLREARSRDGDVALQDACETVAKEIAALGRRLANQKRSGDVGRAVAVLPTGIDQVELARLRVFDWFAQ